ncbi:flagellar biosynthetic protein FliP [Fulvimarina endophytica]|uniref:Flagellar biosynthetic protein FliP n=1 Tax=Fulvimarina endophytica TaxID=2293836 RepID=A0A371X186_9HYPH|nr:flagellar type III secretion system pore protein FliP [Fulvimarina endophytica]RFC63000.1 flagellar biosynthetic protein FliP [Fulvimarina endophytica]
MSRSFSRGALKVALVLLALLGLTAVARAQVTSGSVLSELIPEGDGTMSGRIIQLFGILTVLSIAPGLLVMVTAFTRIVIALSIMRTGLGLQTTPANLIIISLSLFMTFFVMAPTFDQAWRDGLQPLLENEIDEEEAFYRISDPFKDFMLTQVRPSDLALFSDIAAANDRSRVQPEEQGATDERDISLSVLVPAFMISELRRGFEIGFLIVLPFLVIDMIVATLTMSMGMMMLPPTIISLPFKILFFVLIDGWNLLVGSLVRSFF